MSTPHLLNLRSIARALGGGYATEREAAAAIMRGSP
jgi:hypothetical protein